MFGNGGGQRNYGKERTGGHKTPVGIFFPRPYKVLVVIM